MDKWIDILLRVKENARMNMELNIKTANIPKRHKESNIVILLSYVIDILTFEDFLASCILTLQPVTEHNKMGAVCLLCGLR